MPSYSLCIEVMVRVKVSGVKADSRKDAINIALDELEGEELGRLFNQDYTNRRMTAPGLNNMKLVYTEVADEGLREILVDVEGDDAVPQDYDRESMWFAWSHSLNGWIMTPLEYPTAVSMDPVWISGPFAVVVGGEVHSCKTLADAKHEFEYLARLPENQGKTLYLSTFEVKGNGLGK